MFCKNHYFMYQPTNEATNAGITKQKSGNPAVAKF